MSQKYEDKAGAPPETWDYPRSQDQPPPYNTTYTNPVGTPGAPPNVQGQYNTQYGGQYGQLSTVVATQPMVNYVVQDPTMEQEYQKYMIASIVVTFLCCWPIGICAIQKAREAKSAALVGNRAEADRHAAAAKKMIIGAILGGIICIGIGVAILVIRIRQIQDCYGNRYYC